jgi:methylenetetrahydrofolate dehydrogenase (NADP+) / methenyltetrahydrofolate cyclohydrolase
MALTLIDGKAHAQTIKADVKNRAEALKEKGWNPHLVSVHVGENPAASVYVNNQAKACEQVGIKYTNRKYASDITQGELLAAIYALNADPRVTGIILQRPLPAQLDLEPLQNAIHRNKDVEGMNAANIGNIVYGDFSLGPCTSLASVELLRTTGLHLRGLEVVVVGHSEIVGKPVALLLVEELATVTICHHGTVDLAYHTRQADALFVAVGKPGLITGDMIKPGVAIIDIGINQIPTDSGKGTKIVGDVDFESVKDVAGWITPVPGGVGPVTVAMLLRNTITATERQKAYYEAAMKG